MHLFLGECARFSVVHSILFRSLIKLFRVRFTMKTILSYIRSWLVIYSADVLVIPRIKGITWLWSAHPDIENHKEISNNISTGFIQWRERFTFSNETHFECLLSWLDVHVHLMPSSYSISFLIHIHWHCGRFCSFKSLQWMWTCSDIIVDIRGATLLRNSSSWKWFQSTQKQIEEKRCGTRPEENAAE